MPLLDAAAEPTPSTRRWFGLSLALLLGVLGYLFRDAHPAVFWWCATCGLLLAAVYYMLPSTQLPVIRAWFWLTYPLAWVVGHALLLVVYLGVLLPLAVVLRWRRHDPLALRQAEPSSGWIDRKKRGRSDHYFKQY